MRRIIILLAFLFSFVQGFSQGGNDPNKYTWYRYLYGNRTARMWPDTVLNVPADTIYSKDGVARIGSTLYVGNGTKWTATASGIIDIDVFLVAGQSNAIGSATLADSSLIIHADPTMAFRYQNNSIVHINDNSTANFTSTSNSPWPSFARTYNTVLGKKICIVNRVAVGSTQTVAGMSCAGVSNNWDTTGTLFQKSLDTLTAALNTLRSLGYNPIVKGVLWIQGESDGRAIVGACQDSTAYRLAFQKMIERFRAALGSRLAFYIWQTGYYTSADQAGELQVQDVQRKICNGDSLTNMVCYNAPSFVTRNYFNVGDTVHWNYKGCNEAGRIGAEEVINSGGYNFQPQANNLFFLRGNVGIGTNNPLYKLNAFGTSPLFGINSTALNTFPSGLESNLPATAYVVHSSGNWGFSVLRAQAAAGAANITLAKTNNADASIKTPTGVAENFASISFASVDSGGSFRNSFSLQAFTVKVNSTFVNSRLQFVTRNDAGAVITPFHFTYDGRMGIGNGNFNSVYGLDVQRTVAINKDSATSITSYGSNMPLVIDTGTGKIQKATVGIPGYNAQSGTTYTIIITDLGKIVGLSNTAARTITLPAANSVPAGISVWIKDEAGTAATGNITINRSGSDTIDGATSDVLNVNYQLKGYYSNGSNGWFIL